MILALELVGGLVYLLVAGDLLVRGSLALARRAEISPMLVGLTVVAFGTSAPELFVSVRAALGGYPGIAMGNVVGSNIANVLLVLGLPALFQPAAAPGRSLRQELGLVLAVSVVFAALCAYGPLGSTQGLFLLALQGGYLVWAFRRGGGDEAEEARAELERPLGLPSQRRMITLFLVLGLVGLPVGANLIVHGAVELASQLGVSEEVVGVTLVALGTSLPELATTLVAALQRQADLGLGNVLGSNLFNILTIMGVTAVVAPGIPVPAIFLRLDIPVMLAAAVALAWVAQRGVTRAGGIALLACYGTYLTALGILAARGPAG